MSARVVLLHGMGLSRRMWRAQLEALADRYELVAPDLPGHGQAPGPFRIDTAVGVVRELLAEAPAYLVGVSLGGTVAVRAALAEPAKVEGLLLSGTPARMSKRLLLAQRAITAVLPPANLAATGLRIVRPADRRDADNYLADVLAAGRETQSDAMRELGRVDLTPRLGEITARTLVCCGSEDDTNLASVRALSAAVPGAELRIVEGGGHLWNLQQPDLCTRIIADFVG
ncbi:MAG: alpha/beta fold hydrolase [Streptosporangiales bacterium]|nr:alpha/beta fold hydrolase [Streptosporangiales bacterium]